MTTSTDSAVSPSKWIVSATTRDAEPEAVEVSWTRQEVADEVTAARLVAARNRAELAVNGSHVWGYYQEPQ